MGNAPPFIKSIQVNKVRHLQDILILIDESRPRHLIITGPNGSGKTSLLVFLKDYLEGIPTRELLKLENWKQVKARNENQIISLKNSLSISNSEEQKAICHGELSGASENIRQIDVIIAKFNAVIPNISDLIGLAELYEKGEFLISFFEARRFSQIQAVSGPKKLDLAKVNPIAVTPNSPGTRFLQFLVNQKNRAAQLQLRNDKARSSEIESWIKKIEVKFQEIFQDHSLTLDYDIDNFDYKINIPGHEPFRLVDNQLSDGFSSVIHIVAELLLRMEAVTPGNYNVPGIVLIDEIETHLHIKLQKAILPFLTDFFPNIQFIVTTHSPFVLTSLNDAVVFDLESKERWEHMAPMAASTVVESYFGLDLYSNEIKNRVSRYSELAKKSNLAEEENEELNRIRTQLDNIDYESAPELVAQYRSLRAKESTR